MRNNFVAAGIAFAMMATGWLVALPSAEGEKGSAKPAATVRRTADGQPDMRGNWTKAGGALNEANPPRALISAECGEFYGAKAEPEGFNNVTGPKAKPQHGPAVARPQGIVDPADLVLPGGLKRRPRGWSTGGKMGPPAESIEYLELSVRCAPPAPWQGGAVQIFQRRDQVVMLFEGDHGSRVIYTDGRPHANASVRSFAGDSIGHWEGNTLVVDTTNLNGKGSFSRIFQEYGDAMHLTERFTVLAPDLIDYEIVYDNPKLFTRPVKSAGYLFPADDNFEIMESTCTEGSSTLRNIFGF